MLFLVLIATCNLCFLQKDCKSKGSQLVLQLAVPTWPNHPPPPCNQIDGKADLSKSGDTRSSLAILRPGLRDGVRYGESGGRLVGLRGGRAGGGCSVAWLVVVPPPASPAPARASSSFTAASLCAPVSQGTMPGCSEGVEGVKTR